MTNTDRQATLTHELQVGPVGVDNRQSYLELTYFPGGTRRPSPSFQTRSKTLATTTVDRLLHHAHIVLTEGTSLRLAEATAERGVVPLT